jgi:hypothetical protein
MRICLLSLRNEGRPLRVGTVRDASAGAEKALFLASCAIGTAPSRAHGGIFF